jgi:hypothetical protein
LIEAMNMKMHLIQFASRLMVIQMKLMKVICTGENRMTQELQHCTGSRLIEVMTIKMHLIQFASSVKANQMKLMKTICSRENRMA